LTYSCGKPPPPLRKIGEWGMAGGGWEQAGVFQVGEAQEKSAEKIFAETLFLIPPKPM